MFGLGPIEIAVILGLMLFSAVAALGSRTTKLVLQRLVAHEPASGETTPAIELVGRQQGIISFLLTLVGISPITDFRVTPDELCCNSTSLFGRQNQSVPLRAISSIAAGVRKPVGYLFVAFIFLVIGVFGGLGVLWREGLYKFLVSFMVCGAFAGVFIWLYVINKRFFVSVYTQGGPPILLSLKPNVIEGVPLDLERALQVVKIIRDRVVASGVTAPIAISNPIPVPSRNGHQALKPDPDPAEAFSSPRSTYEYSDDSENTFTERPETLLQQARDLIKQGKREEAISVLRGIVLGFPNSSEAGLAKVTLEKAGISV
jgi:hypothetical protein